MSLTKQQMRQSLNSVEGYMTLMAEDATSLNEARRLNDPEQVDHYYNKLQDHLQKAKNSLQHFYQTL